MNINSQIYQRHCNCPVHVDWNYQSRQHRKYTQQNDPVRYCLLESITHTPPALVCTQHRKWLKWLSVSEAQAIERISK
jgi:hypothetical protein